MTALRLAEAVVEVNVTAVDWLANCSDYGVTTKLRKSYEVVKVASKIRIRRFNDNLTTLLLVDLRQKYDKIAKILQQFYDCRMMFCQSGPRM